MKILFNIILVVLIFLAVSSGITKIMLLPQDVEFFGQYGFTNPILVTYGISQLLGGIFLAIPRTRILGASIVAVTFLMSAVVLVMSAKLLVATITIIFVFLLGYIIKQSLLK